MAKKRNLNKVDLRTVKVRVLEEPIYRKLLLEVRFSTTTKGEELGYHHVCDYDVGVTAKDIDEATAAVVRMMHSIEEQTAVLAEDIAEWMYGTCTINPRVTIGATTNLSLQEYEAAYEAITNAKTSGSR